MRLRSRNSLYRIAAFLGIVLVCGAKWDRPVERVHEVCREGNEAIWALNG